MLLSDSNYISGVFTVGLGMNGLYSISGSMMSGGVSAHTTIRKNGEILVWLFTNKEFDMASQTISIALVQGDRIWVQTTNKASSLLDVYNTFSVVKRQVPSTG